MKRAWMIAAPILAAAVLFVAGDYFALFGTQQAEEPGFIEMNFLTVDEQTGAIVENTRARCFQADNRNACAQRDSGRTGIVSIAIPVQKLVTRSLLFEQVTELRRTGDPKLHVMFIHQEYANPVETLYIEDLPALAGKVMTVAMPRPLRGR